MPTQPKNRRVKDTVSEFINFPPEGINEPFKPIEPTFTQRLPFGVGGENRSVPADVIQPDQCYSLVNFKTNLGDVEPAWGYTEVGTMSAADVPNEIILYKELDGTSYLVCIDDDDLNYWNGSTWATATGTLTGATTDKIRAAMVLNQLVFVNGVDEIKTWTGGSTFTNLSADGNRPSTARFVVGFADRVVFADIGTGSSRDTQRVEWCASGDIDDFTSTGSGGVNLYDTQAGAPADDIQGLLVFGNYLVVPRSRSFWIGQRTGVADAPIKFSSHLQGYGVFAPDSVQIVGPTGIMYLGQDNVYLYHPSSPEPIPIGMPIRDRIFEVLDMSKVGKIRSAYVPDTQEYWLLIPDSTNTWGRRAFVFDLNKFRTTEQFVWRERLFSHDISALGSGQTAGLGSTYSEQKKKLLLGESSGKLYDSESSDTSDDGTAFTASFESPQFTAGHEHIQLHRLNIAYRAGGSSDITVSFSTDGGNTYGNSASYSLSGTTGENREVSLMVPLGVYGRSVMVKLTVPADDDINIVGYRLAFLNRGPIFGT